MPVLDNELKARVRSLLAYPQIESPTIMTFGVPSIGEPQYLFERMMDHLYDAYAVEQVKQYVQTMDSLEAQLANVACLVKANVVGDIQPNIDAGEYIEREIVRWGYRLAELLGVMPNPYSVRYGSGGNGINGRVMGNDQ